MSTPKLNGKISAHVEGKGGLFPRWSEKASKGETWGCDANCERPGLEPPGRGSSTCKGPGVRLNKGVGVFVEQ